MEENILDVLKRFDFHFKKEASTNGGEYGGPCPFCGGKDRFRVWPNQEGGGRYWCRQCGAAGDRIRFLMDYLEIGYTQAVKELGITLPLTKADGETRTPYEWQPRESSVPNEIWCKNAHAVVAEWQAQLLTNSLALQWLAERGISEEAAVKGRLGWSATERFIARSNWGLPDKVDEGRTITKLWIPPGLLIPNAIGDTITRIRVRRFTSDQNKYYVLPGSSMSPMVWICDASKAVVLVEAELDGLLLNSVAGDLISVMALGSAQARPDTTAMGLLNAAERILVALDTNDHAGFVNWLWWQKNFGEVARRWPTVKGKDPGEAYKGGLDLRAWIMAGLKKACA